MQRRQSQQSDVVLLQHSEALSGVRTKERIKRKEKNIHTAERRFGTLSRAVQQNARIEAHHIWKLHRLSRRCTIEGRQWSCRGVTQIVPNT